MPDIERHPGDERAHRDHLERSERVWNRWSNWYTLSERDFESIRRRLIAGLDIDPGDRVLDVGCGPGVNFELLRDEIGPEGQLVAIDYSPKMVERAEKRIAENGWENVEVVRADATTADLGGPYDAAVATLSLSVMPDVEAVVRNVHGTLGPGANLGVLDVQPFESGLRRLCNPLVRRFLRWYANWNPDGDVPGAVRAVFEECEDLDTHMGGTAYTLRATRSG